MSNQYSCHSAVKIFIADDSELVRERLVSMLSELPGIEIIGQAGSAADALKLINELNPDLVTLDIRMPVGNGIEVLKRIKRNVRAPIVIMLTNYPYPQYRKKCLESGADYFFDKSSEFEKVLEVIEGIAHYKYGKKTKVRGYKK